MLLSLVYCGTWSVWLSIPMFFSGLICGYTRSVNAELWVPVGCCNPLRCFVFLWLDDKAPRVANCSRIDLLASSSTCKVWSATVILVSFPDVCCSPRSTPGLKRCLRRLSSEWLGACEYNRDVLASRLTSCRWDRPCSSRLVPSWAECLSQRTCRSSTEVPLSAYSKRTWRRLRCRPWRALVFRSRTAGRVSSGPSLSYAVPLWHFLLVCRTFHVLALFVELFCCHNHRRVGLRDRSEHGSSLLVLVDLMREESSLLRITWLMSRCQLWDVWRWLVALTWMWWLMVRLMFVVWSSLCPRMLMTETHGMISLVCFCFYKSTLSFDRIVSGYKSFRSLERLTLMIIRSTSLIKWMLSPRFSEHVQSHVEQIRCVFSSCLSPSHVRLVLMTESFREDLHLRHSSRSFLWSVPLELWLSWAQHLLCRLLEEVVLHSDQRLHSLGVLLSAKSGLCWAVPWGPSVVTHRYLLKGDPSRANQTRHERSVVSSVVQNAWSEYFFLFFFFFPERKSSA